MRFLPAPSNGVSGHPRRVEMIGLDIINLDWAGCRGFFDHSYRNIFQPDGFLPYQPVVRRCSGRSIVLVFTDQLPIGIIEKHELLAQRAIFSDALIQGVVFVGVRFGILDSGGKLTRSIPGKGR